jgi:hypothetical protein
MTFERSIALGLAISLFGLSLAEAAELPSQMKKARPPEAVKHCNVAGLPGVLAVNGVCVRISGYISAGVNARQLK